MSDYESSFQSGQGYSNPYIFVWAILATIMWRTNDRNRKDYLVRYLSSRAYTDSVQFTPLEISFYNLQGNFGTCGAFRWPHLLLACFPIILEGSQEAGPRAWLSSLHISTTVVPVQTRTYSDTILEFATGSHKYR